MRSILRHVIATPLRILVGRRNFARLARFLTLEARLDGGGDDMRRNGELLMLRGAVGAIGPGESAVMFDVGANRGDWTAFVLNAASELNVRTLRVVAFEPTAETYALLTARLSAEGLSSRVQAVQCALSDTAGLASFFVFGPGEGRNSLIPSPGESPQQRVSVQCDTIDGFCDREHVDEVLMLKIDAEGHDLAVLRGASAMLARQAIRVVQFEYNEQWIDSRVFLRDAFDLLMRHGYAVGKVTRVGVERYEHWHFELESWRHANYAAWPRSRDCPVPTLAWWNA